MWDRPLTPEPDFYLDSPGYMGVLHGVLSFEKLDASNNVITTATVTPGATTFKTRVTFTPNNILAVTYEYRTYISGDEIAVGVNHVGVATRSVGDTVLGANTGAGTATFRGGYEGVSADTYNVQIQTPGDFGIATFTWWLSSSPATILIGTVSENETLLTAGVYLSFGGSNFQTGDTFSANVVVSEYMPTTLTWIWTTGSGSITTIPTSTSTSIIGDIGTPAAPVTFAVRSSVPVDLSTDNSIKTRNATINFNQNLDPTFITDDTVTVDIMPALGSTTDGVQPQLNIPKILTVNGSVLTIEF